MNTETVRVLMEAGYMAAGAGMVKDAATIFAGVQAARPKSEYPVIGLAVTLMSAGEHQGAVDLLTQKALELNPGSCLAKSFLGLALKLAGRSNEARAQLEAVLSNCNNDPAATNMAQSLLQEI